VGEPGGTGGTGGRLRPDRGVDRGRVRLRRAAQLDGGAVRARPAARALGEAADLLPGVAGRNPGAGLRLRGPDRLAPGRWTRCRFGGPGDGAVGLGADRLDPLAHRPPEPAQTAARLVGIDPAGVPGPGGCLAPPRTLRPDPGVRPPA